FGNCESGTECWPDAMSLYVLLRKRTQRLQTGWGKAFPMSWVWIPKPVNREELSPFNMPTLEDRELSRHKDKKVQDEATSLSTSDF
ncbi:hypothetical protein C7B82_28370, partial [Stenomitos frigidus ULC18]